MNQVTEARRQMHEAIIEELKQARHPSYMTPAVKFGLTPSAIYNIARKHRIEIEEARRRCWLRERGIPRSTADRLAARHAESLGVHDGNAPSESIPEPQRRAPKR